MQAKKSVVNSVGDDDIVNSLEAPSIMEDRIEKLTDQLIASQEREIFQLKKNSDN